MICTACEYGEEGFIEIRFDTKIGGQSIIFCQRKIKPVTEPCTKFSCDNLNYAYDLTDAQRLLIKNYLLTGKAKTNFGEITSEWQIGDLIEDFLKGEITEEEMRKEIKFTKAKRRAN